MEQKTAWAHSLEEAIGLFPHSGDKWSLSASLNDFGDVFNALGEYDKARVLYEEGLAGFREVGDAWMTAHANKNLGRAYFLEGDTKKTELFLQKKFGRKGD